MARHEDKEFFFKGISLCEIQNVPSVTGQVLNFGGFSFSAGFADRLYLNPNTTSPAEVGQMLATLIKRLFYTP